MKILFVVAGSLPFALAGCSSTTCQSAEILSDNSSATYSATGAVFSSDGDAGQGSVLGLTASALSAGEFQLTGGFGSQGQGSFTITVSNVPPSGSAALTSASKACVTLGSAMPCESLSGTIDVTSFSTSCGGGTCALSIVGTLKGSATLSNGNTFSIDASLNHSEELSSYPCGNQGGE